MCGIYCCLKCTKFGESTGNYCEDSVLHRLKEYLKHRGPDAFSEYKINVGSKWLANFAGSVLWMQGSDLTIQPLLDDEYNILLWNGDVFNGSMVNHGSISDTLKISQSFSQISRSEIPVILSSIQGPYAFIYLDIKKQRLYFGRDRLGRHSLLWSSDCEGGLVLTSVGKRNVLDFKEIPAIGIFMVDMNSSDLEPITLYPWSDISAETVSNVVEESVLKVKISSETVRSPITTLGESSREELLESEHLLSQYYTEVVTGVHHIRDVMEELQSDTNVKKSVQKLISLLRDAVRVRVQTHPGFCKECLQCAKHMDIETHMHKEISKHSGLKYQQESLQSSVDSAMCEVQLSDTSYTNNEHRSICVNTSVCQEKNLTLCPSLKHTDVGQCSQSSFTPCQEMWISRNAKLCHHSKIGILFSGGLDSTILAALADEFVPHDEPIDLLNVAFEREKKKGDLNKKQSGKKKHLDSSQDEEDKYLVPDRITGKRASDDLKKLYPNRQWNFVQIDVTQEELVRERDKIISDLIYPLNTVLDESLGCALWFASRGKGYLVQPNGPRIHYNSPTRVLVLGMGADELFGGYRRHRTALNLEGWNGLRNELQLDLSRISTRNLGRDNRIISDHGCQGRLPYLDESVVSYVSSLQPWERCYPKPAFPPGVGDKLLLRLVAWKLGLHYAAGLPKRAFQFGSRIANSKERAGDVSSRL